MPGVVDLPVRANAGGQSNAQVSVIPTGLFANSIKVSKTKQGTHILKGMRIFKEGTFKDSMGFERTWESSHLEQMIFHFKLLRDGGHLPNVPVRVDHSFSVENVVGYFIDVYRAEDDPTFLAADVEITEPDAFDKWERGTYRSRSLEVGMYETNDAAMYWPVIVGLAFVDLPAVEGLHSRAVSNGSKFSQVLQDDDKENPTMFTFNGQQFADQAACEAAITYAAALEAEEFARACAYAQALEQHNQNAKALGVEGVTVVTATHSQGTPNTTFFRVENQSVSDVTLVQQHINTLEQFRTETTKVNRESFVDALAKANKIGANQIDQFKSHVSTLDVAQYAAFVAMYELAPAHSLLQPHGSGGGDLPPNGVIGDTEKEKFEIARDTVDQLKRSGMPTEQIEKTSAFKTFTGLEAKFSGTSA